MINRLNSIVMITDTFNQRYDRKIFQLNLPVVKFEPLLSKTIHQYQFQNKFFPR